MSDLDRLAADLGQELGSGPVPSIELEHEPERRAAQLEALARELESAPAALVSVADGGGTGRWTASELERALAGDGLTVGWLGLTDAHGELGRRAGLTAMIGGTKAEAARELLAGGALGLRFDHDVDLTRSDGRARVCIASYEFVGPTRTGGIGTAYTSLAEALAAEGHEVVVLFSGLEEGEAGLLRHWRAHYRKLGIDLQAVPAKPPSPVEAGHRHSIRAHQVYEWLRDAHRERPFDVIHVPEVLGHGFFVVRAKRQGLAFAGATIAIGTHSSTSWVLEMNGTLLQARDDFVDDFCERRTVAGADVVISPSAYMLDWTRSRGWLLPRRHFVQQYVRSAAVSELERATRSAKGEGEDGPAEVVFFGRLERRKGLRVFCDALDRLAATGGEAPATVTFLGKEATLDGEPAGEFIERRAASWPWEAKLISDLGQPEAVAYLRAPGARLTVIPSLADNSPNTVYEALALRLPFIASRVGGTGELIDPRDLETATFDPGEPDDERSRAHGAEELASRIAAALAGPRMEAPRPAVDAEVCRRAHLEWHAALAGSGGANPAPAPGPATVSVCIVGTDPERIARTRATIAGGHELLEAPSPFEAAPKGERVLYLEAGIELEPGAIETLTTAAENAKSTIVALPIRALNGDDLERLPVGGPAVAGLFRRAFGDSAFMIEAGVLAELGGFDGRVAGGLQAHLLLCAAAIRGIEIDVVGDVLARAGDGVLPELEVISPAQRVPALVELYAAAPEPILRQLPLLAQQTWTMIGLYERLYSDLYRDRFGRFSVQVRYVVHKVRQMQALWRRVRGAFGRRR